MKSFSEVLFPRTCVIVGEHLCVSFCLMTRMVEFLKGLDITILRRVRGPNGELIIVFVFIGANVPQYRF